MKTWYEYLMETDDLGLGYLVETGGKYEVFSTGFDLPMIKTARFANVHQLEQFLRGVALYWNTEEAFKLEGPATAEGIAAYEDAVNAVDKGKWKPIYCNMTVKELFCYLQAIENPEEQECMTTQQSSERPQ